jgi:hypothetical protein
MNGIGRDVAYSIRLLRRAPGFTVAAVLTLALGIGANAAIYSLADASLLHPVRVADPLSLYSIRSSSTYPDYLAYAGRDDLFTGVVASSGGRVSAIVNGSAELVEARFVSGNYFAALGADRARIRSLVLRQGAWPVAVGVMVGLALAALGGRLAGAFLRGVTSHDPLTYAAVIVVLVTVAGAATWIPARRAACLEPMQALRDH